MGTTESAVPETKTVPYEEILRYVSEDLNKQLHAKGANSHSGIEVYVFILMKLARYPGQQPQHIDEFELEIICNLRKQGLSVGDIAFAVDRSTSSVFETLKKNGLTP
jgi:hypothetical protein